jgi:uncharacterized membrane protein
MNASGASAGLGLIAAATWGGSDFVGGVGARRAPALLVVASGHVVSFLILLAYCLGIRPALPGTHSLVYAMVAGFEGSLALALFYRALAMGAMGLTAALTGLLTALVPVVFSLFYDGLPSLLTMAGLGLGLAAIWLITHTPAKGGPSSPHAALLLGALAGTGFGTQLILFKMASPGGLLWTMTSARAVGSVAMILLADWHPRRNARHNRQPVLHPRHPAWPPRRSCGSLLPLPRRNNPASRPRSARTPYPPATGRHGPRTGRGDASECLAKIRVFASITAIFAPKRA